LLVFSGCLTFALLQPTSSATSNTNPCDDLMTAA
jgi:hypothetical protein